MKRADEIWWWFSIGSFLTGAASLNFGLAISNIFAKNASAAMISGGFGGIFAGLLIAIAIKLWLQMKIEENQR